MVKDTGMRKVKLDRGNVQESVEGRRERKETKEGRSKQWWWRRRGILAGFEKDCCASSDGDCCFRP